MTKRCIGCGAVLLNTDKTKNGYTPKLENKYCMRCFRLTNYNDLTETITEKDNDISVLREYNALHTDKAEIKYIKKNKTL